MKRSLSHRKLVLSALFLALALVLPFLTGQIPAVGNALCPMHYPVLLCGFVCGGPWGFAVGAIAPLLRTLLFGMPPAAQSPAMACELAVYGLVTGLLYRRLPRRPQFLYLSLIAAMVAGRLVWGAARFVMAGLSGSTFHFSAFLAGAVLNAVPGIALQLILVPLIVLALQRAGVLDTDAPSPTV